jgi:hypothetical protein
MMITSARTTPRIPPTVVRIVDGLPVDALPDPQLQPDAYPSAADEWRDGLHLASYVSGWRWGAINGLLTGAILVAAAFAAGWNTTP